MTEEFHQQIGKILSTLENNTSVIKDIANDVGELKESVADVSSSVRAHSTYLKNLDDRVVSQRKDHDVLHDRVTVIETKSETNAGVIKWVGGILSAVIGSIITFLFTHK